MVCPKNVLNAPCNTTGEVNGNITGNVVGDITGNVYSDFIFEATSGAGITFMDNVNFLSGISIDFSNANVSGLSGTGGLSSGVGDGTYYVSEITVSGNQITDITTHRDANRNIFIGDNTSINASNADQVCIGTQAITNGGDIAIGPQAECGSPQGRNIAFGYDTFASGSSICLGTSNSSTGSFCTLVGNNNTNSGTGGITNLYSHVLGSNNTLSDFGRSTVVGTNCNIVGDGTNSNSFVGGFNTDCFITNSTILGDNCSIGNLTTTVAYTVAIGTGIDTQESDALILGGSGQFSHVYVNDLASTTNTSGYSSVLYDPTTSEIVYSPNNSGGLWHSGSFLVSGTGIITETVGFLPKHITFTQDVGMSGGSTKGMIGSYTKNADGTEVQYSTSWYAFATARSFNSSNAIAISNNGSTFQTVCNITTDLASQTSFEINCTTYNFDERIYYDAAG